MLIVEEVLNKMNTSQERKKCNRRCYLCNSLINNVTTSRIGRTSTNSLLHYGSKVKRKINFISDEGKVCDGKWFCNECYDQIHKYVDWNIMVKNVRI